MDNIKKTIKLCHKQHREWKFINHSFKIDFDFDSKNRIIFKCNNFFDSQIDYIITVNDELGLGIGHCAASGGADILMGAGRIVVNKYGYVTYLDNKSGHYKPKLENLQYSVDFLQYIGVDTKYCQGVLFNWKMEIVHYINKEPQVFIPQTTDIDFSTQKMPCTIEIPNNFDWQVYMQCNNLHYLDNENNCIEHYKTIGYLSHNRIAKNPKYSEND